MPQPKSPRRALVRRSLRRICATLGLAILVLIAPALVKGEDALPSDSELKKLSLEQLMDVEVTSVSRSPEKLLEAPSAIQVITNDDILRSGATSIPEALRLADNLDVAQKGSHAWAISARGFNTDSANKLLVLIDGRSVYTPLFSGVFWDQQDYLLQDIDRIEVISGPGGTLWGANAVNGVINIITKSAKDTQGLYAEAGGGSILQDFVGVRYGLTVAPDVYLRVYGKYFDRDSEVFPNGDDASDSWRMGQGGFRMDAKVSPDDGLTFQGDFYSGDEGVATGGRVKVNGNNVLGRWSHTFSEDSDMSLQVYYDRTHLNDPVPGNSVAPEGRLIDDLNTFDVDFQHRFRLWDFNHVVWGLGYRFTDDAVENAPGLAFFPTTLDHHLFSGFVQDEVSLVKKLTLTLGTKIEHNDYTGFEVEPSVRLSWTPTEQQTVWAAVSRAIRAPSRIDRDVRLPTPFFAPLIDNLLIGGANFESETVIAYELGYRLQVASQFSISASTFYNVYDDIRSTSLGPPPFGLPLFYANNLEGDNYGLELSANYRVFDWWRLHGGFDLLREDIHVKSGQFDFNKGFNETADPKHQFSLRSSMDLPQNIEFDVALRYVDSFEFNNNGVPGTVPSYFELETRLAWHPTKNLEVAIVGQNLLHDQHLEYVISSPNPREEIQRSIYGKVTWRF